MERIITTTQFPNELNNSIKQAVVEAIADVTRQIEESSKYPMYMNIKQTASYLGVSYNTIKKWINRYPDFPCKAIDGSYHINREALDRFMTNK